MLSSASSKLFPLTSNTYQRELLCTLIQLLARTLPSSSLSKLTTLYIIVLVLEECLPELGINFVFIDRLLLYGMCCSLEERYDEGKEFFDLATTIDGENVVTWTIRGTVHVHYMHITACGT